MRNFILSALLIGLMANGQLSAQPIISRNGYPEHFAAGMIIGGTVSYLTYRKTDNKLKSMAFGFLATVGVGALKEIADPIVFNGTRSWKDFGYTALGGVVGVSIVLPLKSRKMKPAG
ncbi:MAG: hypothetical protein H6562_04165 [Lewinellaceae bacterium]|nr:hypothetical protein [Lewinella sp.]MCB9278081.1 hypothetical protein [Lewinellaceae bacterium]